MWIPSISRAEGPRYLAVANAIAEAIDSGELAPGTRLPPQRDLAHELGVTVGTIGRAYTLMKKRRLVSGEVGRGTFVRGERQPNQNIDFTRDPRNERMFDFGCFRSPVPGLTNEISAAIAKVAQGTAFHAMQAYPPGSGYLSHRTDAANWLARVGLEVSPKQIVLTAGAQSALSVALSALAKAEDTVLTECLTYSGLRALSHIQGLKLAGLDMDEFGLIPEALEAACAATEARILYVQPTVHNPTAAMMPEERRREIATIARAHDLLIIEDDAATSALTDRPVPLAKLAPERTIYITSVCKSISPALRFGFMVAPLPLSERLESTNHSMNLGVSPIVAEAMSVLISKGSAEGIAQRYLQESKKRHAVAAEVLGRHVYMGHPAAFFIWLPLPSQWQSEQFAAAALRAGVNVVGAENFIVGHSRPADGVRVSVNGVSSIEGLREGLGVLEQLLSSQPQPQLAVI